MAGDVLNLDSLLLIDSPGAEISNQWITWNNMRQPKMQDWDELRKYIYATDTTKTTNSKLPWKNKTTIPKLCQIRDNLFSNYMAALFPKRKNIHWLADDKSSNTKKKRKAITNYMCYVMEQKTFKDEVSKLILDYIDYGNCFAMVDWEDGRVELEDESRTQAGWVGPVLRRISPLDIVFNPIADSFDKSPKIIRSIVSLGEVKEYLERLTTDDNREQYQNLWNYLKGIRNEVHGFGGELQYKDAMFNVDGFTSFQQYLGSNYCELLTFYGDMYDAENDKFLKNYKITVVDRHKIIDKRPNPSYFGKPPIYHVGWRKRQDNLWAMGPLDNLVGLQYRIDHIENLKADVFDLITFPPLKIKGYVEDFEWGPFERIVTSEEGDVEMIVPSYNVLTANTEVQYLMALMEEMAGSPKEAMGFRTPGEKTKYEVERLENAASRIFQNKTGQFEINGLEEWLNAMLELGRRKISGPIAISVFNDEFQMQTFMDLTPQDITGNGRVRPVAARHFAEQAQTVQNITAFANSPLGQDPAINVHISGLGMAQFMIDEMLDLSEYGLVQPYIRIAEQADAQRQQNVQQERVSQEAATATGIGDDYDTDLEQNVPVGPAQPLDSQSQAPGGAGGPPAGGGAY